MLALAGLQTIPKTLYEANSIDGAGKVKQFFTITLPMVSPTLFVVMIMRLMSAVKVYDLIYMMVETMVTAAGAQTIGRKKMVRKPPLNLILAFSSIATNRERITDARFVMIACAVVAIWSNIGYDAVLLLAGLQTIPKTLYEANSIDGAGTVIRFWEASRERFFILFPPYTS